MATTSSFALPAWPRAFFGQHIAARTVKYGHGVQAYTTTPQSQCLHFLPFSVPFGLWSCLVNLNLVIPNHELLHMLIVLLLEKVILFYIKALILIDILL